MLAHQCASTLTLVRGAPRSPKSVSSMPPKGAPRGGGGPSGKAERARITLRNLNMLTTWYSSLCCSYRIQLCKHPFQVVVNRTFEAAPPGACAPARKRVSGLRRSARAACRSPRTAPGGLSTNHCGCCLCFGTWHTSWCQVHSAKCLAQRSGGLVLKSHST